MVEFLKKAMNWVLEKEQEAEFAHILSRLSLIKANANTCKTN